MYALIKFSKDWSDEYQVEGFVIREISVAKAMLGIDPYK